MHRLIFSHFTFLLAALFASQVAAAVLDGPISARQNQSQISCQEYATLANLSVIAGNSTFRGAFIQASPDGTEKSESILTNALNEFTDLHLINDTALNDQCGNLTMTAIAGAPANFSEGLIGPFHIGMGVRLGSGAGSTAMVTAAMVGAAMLLL